MRPATSSGGGPPGGAERQRRAGGEILTIRKLAFRDDLMMRAHDPKPGSVFLGRVLGWGSVFICGFSSYEG